MGHGDISGTRQSGLLNFKLADIVKDKQLLEVARGVAGKLLDADPDIIAAKNAKLKNHLQAQQGKTQWSKIS